MMEPPARCFIRPVPNWVLPPFLLQIMSTAGTCVDRGFLGQDCAVVSASEWTRNPTRSWIRSRMSRTIS